jgi:hypothetical protein
MRTPTRFLAIAVVLATAGCAAAPAAPSTPAPSPQPTPAPVRPTVVLPTSPPTELPVASTVQPLLTGDASTNAACRLATVAEISAQVGAGVREIKGLTGTGAYAKNSLSCAWYLDSEDIGIPSVVVQWEFPVESWHDAVVDLYRSIVDQGLATAIADTGDTAILQGRTAEAVAGTRIVRVSVLQHLEPTEKDKADAIALLQLFLERTAQP